jgi:hypothetical protein
MNARLALAHAAHETVRERLGSRAPPPTNLPRAVPRPAVGAGAGAYRGKDEQVELQRAIDEARAAARNLRAESSMLESQCDMKFPPPPFAETRAGFWLILLGILAVIGGFAWLTVRFGGDKAGGALTSLAVLVFVLVRIFRTDKSNER